MNTEVCFNGTYSPERHPRTGCPDGLTKVVKGQVRLVGAGLLRGRALG